jgi:hypothetical protein
MTRTGAGVLEPLESGDAVEVHDLRRPLARSSTVEPFPDGFTNESVASFTAFPGCLVEPLHQSVVEVNAEIHHREL